MINHDNAEVCSVDKGILRQWVLKGDTLTFYCSYTSLRELAKEWLQEIPHEVWYTERNGDGIGMICSKDLPPSSMPRYACGYLVFEWIQPEDDFGTGVNPRGSIDRKQ